MPTKIDVNKLFDLDVDEDIWQDLGLQDDADEAPAPWQVDPDVRSGIRQMLELDRCEEEEERLAHERASMQEWLEDEWNAVENALSTTGTWLINSLRKLSLIEGSADTGMQQQLILRKRMLCRLAFIWRRKIGHMRANRPLPDTWGPSDEEILDAGCEEFSEAADVREDDLYDDEYEEEVPPDEDQEWEDTVEADLAATVEEAEIWYGQEMVGQEIMDLANGFAVASLSEVSSPFNTPSRVTWSTPHFSTTTVDSYQGSPSGPRRVRIE